jgi:hypothetical protein
MTPEQLREFDDFEEMVATPGFKRMVEQARKTIYQYQADALEAPSWERVCILRGKAEALAELVNFEDSLALHKRTLLEEEFEDASL